MHPKFPTPIEGFDAVPIENRCVRTRLYRRIRWPFATAHCAVWIWNGWQFRGTNSAGVEAGWAGDHAYLQPQRLAQESRLGSLWGALERELGRGSWLRR